MTSRPELPLQDLLDARYSDAPDVPEDLAAATTLRTMAARGSCRVFRDQPVPMPLLQILSATALAAPTKSDLQQRDIILLQDASLRADLAALVGGQTWVANAPVLAVFCGNNRRQRMLHAWRGIAFANDHLDAFFNAATDAAIALGAFVTAAEAVGLGCCPISAVRNEAQAVSELLDLPDHVFPFAGLAIGYPAATPQVAMRLPLSVTCHVNRYREAGLSEAVAAYDKARADVQPFEKQRFVDRFGSSPTYGWSEDKVRQYSAEERAGFGAYVKARKFRLE